METFRVQFVSVEPGGPQKLTTESLDSDGDTRELFEKVRRRERELSDRTKKNIKCSVIAQAGGQVVYWNPAA